MRPVPRHPFRPLGALLAALCLLAGCASPARRAFYYWKAERLPSAAETAFLDRLRIDRLYLRLFDLGPAGEPQSVLALPRTGEGLTAGGRREVVPVVYVVPEVLRKAGEEAAGTLGERTGREVLGRCRAAGLEPSEVQIDYDWTAGTREAFFRFLEGVRRGLPSDGRRTVLSATVRLHQVRDLASAGVPPVDRGLLMAYNLSAPADPGVRNSILDLEALEPYLGGLAKYPLPLDVALPCFSWIVQFESRRVLGLIPYAAARGVETDPAFAKAGENWLEARERTYVAGRSVEPGDRLRIEKVDPALVLAAARALAARLPRGARHAAFFSLDRDALDAFSGGSDEAFEAVYRVLGAGAARGR